MIESTMRYGIILLLLLSGCTLLPNQSAVPLTGQENDDTQVCRDIAYAEDAANNHTGDKADNVRRQKVYDNCLQYHQTRRAESGDSSGIQDIHNELRRFFREHPEYLRSREKNESLYIQFLYVINTPQYRNLGMYDALTMAHQKTRLYE